MPSSAEIIMVDDQDMDLSLSLPNDSGPFAAVMVIQHAGGVDSFTRTMTDRLAVAGYAAVAPDLYHRITETVDRADKMVRLKQLKDLEIFADIGSTVEFLRNHPAAVVTSYRCLVGDPIWNTKNWATRNAEYQKLDWALLNTLVDRSLFGRRLLWAPIT